MKLKSLTRLSLLLAGLVAMAAAIAAADIRDGKAYISPLKDGRYAIQGFELGKAELYGYIGDLRDTEHVKGIVLKNGGSDEQRHIIGTIAGALGLEAFEQDGRELRPIEVIRPEQPAAPAAQPATQPADKAGSEPETAAGNDRAEPHHG